MTKEEKKAYEKLDAAVRELTAVVAKMNSAYRKVRNAQIDLNRARRKADKNQTLF